MMRSRPGVPGNQSPVLSWLAQIPHVMAKDIRQARWMLLVHLGVVGVAALAAVQHLQSGWPFADVSMFLVVITGMLSTAFLMQADSPARSDAVWATPTLRPSAVLAARMLAALLIILGVPLVAQLLILLANNVAGVELLALIARSAWIYALWLLIAMMLAALTPDLRTFTIELSLIPVSLMLTTSVLVVVIPRLFQGIFRSPTPRAWVLNTSGVTDNLMPPFVVEIPSSGSGRTHLTVGVDSSLPTGRLLTLESVMLTLHLRNGGRLRVPVPSALMLERPVLPVGGEVRWVGGLPYSAKEHSQVVHLTREQRNAIDRGVTGASLDGTVVAVEPGVALTLPCRPGESRRSGAKAVDVVAAHPGNYAIATVTRSWIGRTGPPEADWLTGAMWDMPRYVLVNRARGEATVAGRAHGGGSSTALVLPGVGRWTEPTHLYRVSRSEKYVPWSEHWLHSAELVVLDWRVRARGHIRVNAALRQAEGSTNQ